VSDNRRINILLVDDQPADLLTLEVVLEDIGATIVRAGSGEEALQKVLTTEFAVILLDVRMPTMSGFETAQLIRSWPKCRTTPIIFITAAHHADLNLEEAYAMGAVDFLTKPLIPVVIKAKVAFFVDLHLSKQEVLAERRLRESEERLRLATEAGGLGLWAWDPAEDRLTWENDLPYRLFGTSPAQGPVQTDRFIAAFVHPDDADALRQAMSAAAASEARFQFQGRFHRGPDRELRWFEFTGRALAADRGAVPRVLGTVADITERKQVEQDLRRFAAQLSDADSKKNEFLAMLAHELRNPLAAVRNALRVLRLADEAPATTGKNWDMLERQIAFMVRLVDDLLDVTRISIGKLDIKKERVALDDIVASAVEMSRTAIENGHHDLDVRCPPQPVLLDADPVRLAQVLSNLLNNAAKYTPAGGSIELEATLEGEVVAVSVTDNGVGIPEQSLPAMFEMFTQMSDTRDRAQGGLGIGLSLVRKLVELHGGTVLAESRGAGQGSRFIVRLPLAGSAPFEAPLPHGSGLEADGSPARKLRVLIADDNADAAQSFSFLLEIAGHATRVAGDGHKAVRSAQEFRPDVVFLDIGLPGMNGYEVARALRQTPGMEELVIVALTGWGADRDPLLAREAGFHHHLTKPADPAIIDGLLSRLGKLQHPAAMG
jgi:PAS domain S-box-containing protein